MQTMPKLDSRAMRSVLNLYSLPPKPASFTAWMKFILQPARICSKSTYAFTRKTCVSGGFVIFIMLLSSTGEKSMAYNEIHNSRCFWPNAYELW